VSYFGTSHLGTPEVAFEKSGEVTWRAQAQAFGETQITLNTIDNALRFPGQYFDVETGLYQNYFRDYDPQLGRYVQSDPIGLYGGLNRFVYVESNPFNHIDVLGLYCISLSSRRGDGVNVGGPRFKRYVLGSDSMLGIAFCKFKKMGMQRQKRSDQERLLCYECIDNGCGEEECALRVWMGEEITERRAIDVVMDRWDGMGLLMGDWGRSYNLSKSLDWSNSFWLRDANAVFMRSLREAYEMLMVTTCLLMFLTLLVLMPKKRLCISGLGRTIFLTGFFMIFLSLIFSNYLYPVLVALRGEFGYIFRISFHASLVGMILVCLGVLTSVFWSRADRSNA